jgi:hypothetical protein
MSEASGTQQPLKPTTPDVKITHLTTSQPGGKPVTFPAPVLSTPQTDNTSQAERARRNNGAKS